MLDEAAEERRRRREGVGDSLECGDGDDASWAPREGEDAPRARFPRLDEERSMPDSVESTR